MKIINRYILKEHIGPFVFALSAATSLMLLQYIARRFGDLVGKGLSWQIITEFLLLSIPFTLALTLPMSALVAVLYAFSRIASENEVTALKAGGVSTRSLLWPVLGAAICLAIFTLYFNDRILPAANHELATLQTAIMRTKPTFALKEQVVNTVKEGQLYLRAGSIARDESGDMRDVTIYDLSDVNKRKTIYADSGTLGFAPNHRDLVMHLFHGMMLSAPSNQSGQLSRIYYVEDRFKVPDVANSFQSLDADTTAKGEREMNICEMQVEYERAHAEAVRAIADSVRAVTEFRNGQLARGTPAPKTPVTVRPAGGIGALYCAFITKYLHVKEAEAAEVPRAQQRQQPRQAQQPQQLKPTLRQQQDTTKRLATPAGPAVQRPVSDSVYVLYNGAYIKVPRNKVPAGAVFPGATAAPTPGAPVGAPAAAARGAAPPPATAVPPVTRGLPASASLPPPGLNVPLAVTEAKMRLDDARYHERRMSVEIQKKFSLAAACIVFVLVGAPVALRFPRGGVGFVFALSFSIFAIYYVALNGGEELANHAIITPFWAEWGANVLFTVVGLAMLPGMGREGVTSRGGNFGELTDATRAWFARQGRRVGLGRAAGAAPGAAP